MNTENTLLTHSNLVNKKFNLSKINIKIVECNDTAYSIVLEIGKKASQKWHIEMPTNIKFLKRIQCNRAEEAITAKEFQFYRKMTQIAYALSIYFIDIKVELAKEVISETAFAGECFYEYAEDLFQQIHTEIMLKLEGENKL